MGVLAVGLYLLEYHNIEFGFIDFKFLKVVAFFPIQCFCILYLEHLDLNIVSLYETNKILDVTNIFVT
jgi:hypothetical protein